MLLHVAVIVAIVLLEKHRPLRLGQDSQNVWHISRISCFTAWCPTTFVVIFPLIAIRMIVWCSSITSVSVAAAIAIAPGNPYRRHIGAYQLRLPV